MAEAWLTKRLARLMAVQALYSWDAEGGGAPWPRERLTPEVVAFFREQAAGEGEGEDSVTAVELAELAAAKEDRKLFRSIVAGATVECAALDALLLPFFTRMPNQNQIAMLPRAILRAGAFEVKSLGTPPAVVIAEYARVAELFCAQDEVGFIHAVLDKVAKTGKE